MKSLFWFVKFFCTSLGFVNFKLYQNLNLYYPPQLTFKSIQRTKNSSRKDDFHLTIESLNIPLMREFVEVEEEVNCDINFLVSKKFYNFLDYNNSFCLGPHK